MKELQHFSIHEWIRKGKNQVSLIVSWLAADLGLDNMTGIIVLSNLDIILFLIDGIA